MMQERKTRGELLERPLSARSVLASLLLGMRPPRLSSARLVRWGALFGIPEGTTRVALSRMVERGELTVDGGMYELAGTVRARQREQERALAPALAPWDGQWVVAVVVRHGRAASDRTALRRAMDRLRLAELREGVWTRPDNLSPDMADPVDRRVADGQCTWWRASPEDRADALAAHLFRPVAWAERARVLLARLRDETAALAGGAAADHLAPGFVVGAAALQHLRRDPLLPPALLPAGWPGDDLRAAYRAYQPTYATAVAQWFRDGSG